MLDEWLPTKQIEVLFKWNCVASRGFFILSVEKRRRAIKSNIKESLVLIRSSSALSSSVYAVWS